MTIQILTNLWFTTNKKELVAKLNLTESFARLILRESRLK